MGEDRSRRCRRLAIVSALSLLGLASVLGVVIVSLPPAEVRRRLPDGSELTLEGVTFGKTTFHHLEESEVTGQFLRLLPGWLLERAGFSKAKLRCDITLTLPRVRVVEFTARPSA